MAPVNADVGEVEAQLSAIRRRHNGLAAQRALAGIGSATLIAASLMIVTALRGSTSLFVLTTALAIGGTVACIGYLAWMTWHDWLSLPATAHLADTRAALDERLTTLLAVGPLSPPPPLRSLLLDQVIRARSRWGVEALAPQRISPWLALVPLALAVFAATTFYARPPAAAATRRTVTRASSVPATSPGSASAPRPARGEILVDQSGRDAATSAAGAATATRAGASGASTTGGEAGAETGSTPAGGTAGGEVPAGGPLDKLRQSIQDTFGGAQGATERQPGTGAETGERRNRGSGDDTGGDGTSSPARTTDARQNPAQSSPQGRQPDPANHATAEAQGSQGSGRGGSANGGTTGVLGTSPSAPDGGGKAAPMGIKLSAVSGVAPSQTEPQRRNDVPAAGANASHTGGPLPALSEEQLADATVRPLDVGPEHEAIIRRIFTRE